MTTVSLTETDEVHTSATFQVSHGCGSSDAPSIVNPLDEPWDTPLVTITTLDSECHVEMGSLPPSQLPDESTFEHLWALHPDEQSELVLHGRTVKVPRWDRAYAKEYSFSNQTARVHETPDELKGFLAWAQDHLDSRLNGLFVNWHDGSQGHYHGRHRDSIRGLVSGSPIVTISLGEERVFRLRPYAQCTRIPPVDLVLQHGDLVLIPWMTNRNWTHEVPRFARYRGRRISITLRAFQ